MWLILVFDVSLNATPLLAGVNDPINFTVVVVCNYISLSGIDMTYRYKYEGKSIL